jgi:hypothetical protein
MQRSRGGRSQTVDAPELALLLGEIRTGLVQNSFDLPGPLAAEVLDLRSGGRVRTATRPISYALSPELPYGVHCPLATISGAGVNGIGTALTRASITGGRVLQVSTRALLSRTNIDYRLPWSHYVARLGVIEVSGKRDPDDLADGFLQSRSRTTLDLGAISGRVLDTVQRSRYLDRSAPFVARRTQFRFVAHLAANEPLGYGDEPPGRSAPGPAKSQVGAGDHVELVIDDDFRRTFRIRTATRNLVGIVNLCEDLALHDWLLTTVLDAVDGRGGPSAGGDWVLQLRPIIDHILHLWIPGGRVEDELLTAWDALERRPGFSRQWEGLVTRIRDQMALSMLSMTGARPQKGPEIH